MPLTQEDQNIIKDLLHDYIQGVIAKQVANYDIINLKLDIIKDQGSHFDKRINKLEDAVIVLEKENISKQNSCIKDSLIKELEKRINQLEDSQLSQKSIKNWVVKSIGLTIGVVGLIITILKATGVI